MLCTYGYNKLEHYCRSKPDAFYFFAVYARMLPTETAPESDVHVWHCYFVLPVRRAVDLEVFHAVFIAAAVFPFYTPQLPIAWVRLPAA